MRQRLGFAIAMLSDPPVLILDEPTASLDASSRELLARRVDELADEGKTILLSTHSEEQLLGIGDRTVMLEAGRVIADCQSEGPSCSGLFAPGGSDQLGVAR
jgi:ABC-type multidrug transport system ATPase subunit